MTTSLLKDYEELVAQAGEKYFRSEQRGTTSIEEQCENASNQEGGNTSKQEKGGITSGCQQEDIMEIIDDDEIVKSTTPIPQLNQRRPVKPAKSQRSPYVDVDQKKSFTVSKTVNDVYNKACRYGWKSRTALKFERILDYDDNFLIMADLADSVKPRSELVNKTAEIAIYILGQENTNPKKLIMPLRMSTYLIDCRFELKEVTKKFACAPGNRLDHKELIMFPVLQYLTPDEVEKNGHYFVFNLNISAQCFEVMDSLRGEHDVMMMDACQFFAASIKYMWNKNYQHSKFR